MAEEIITQIPGYEAGRVHRVNADDEIGASFLIAKMVSDLRTRWNTSVAVLSLDGHKDAIEAIVPADGSIVKTLILDQKNPDINIIERKLRGHGIVGAVVMLGEMAAIPGEVIDGELILAASGIERRQNLASLLGLGAHLSTA